MRRAFLLLASVATAMLLASVVVLVTAIASVRSAATAAERPNILFVMTDDMPKRLWRSMPALRDRWGRKV